MKTTFLILMSLFTFCFSNAQVGVGTTTPAYNLHVHDSSGATVRLLLSNSSPATLGLKVTLNTGGAAYLQNDLGGSLFLRTGAGVSASGMTIYGTNKYVGINTSTTATNRLHVIDTINPLRLEGVQTSTENMVLVIDSTGVVTKTPVSAFADGDWLFSGVNLLLGPPGNVSIGAPGPPTSKLDVGGSKAFPIRVDPAPLPGLPFPGDHTVIYTFGPGAIAVPLPAATTAPGRIYVLKFMNVIAGHTIVPIATDAIEGAGVGVPFPVPLPPPGYPPISVTLQSDGMDWWVIGM